jgi:hypothetical protein
MMIGSDQRVFMGSKEKEPGARIQEPEGDTAGPADPDEAAISTWKEWLRRLLDSGS